MRREAARIFVHAADQALLAKIVGDSQLLDDGVDFGQNRTVEGIVIQRFWTLNRQIENTQTH